MDTDKNIICGISGTIGAGKGTVVDFLKKEYGFTHFSARDFITRELDKRELPPTRDNMKMVADELRAQHTPSYLIEELFREAQALGGNAVIESVRTLGEARFLKSHGAVILAIDADRRIRYKRIAARGLSTDHVSFEEFGRQEDAELANDNPNQQNILGVMELADYCIENNGQLSDFHMQVEKIFSAY